MQSPVDRPHIWGRIGAKSRKEGERDKRRAAERPAPAAVFRSCAGRSCARVALRRLCPIHGCNMSDVTYEIVEHDGGWAYKAGGVFSEPFPTHAAALRAAQAAAAEQKVPGATA